MRKARAYGAVLFAVMLQDMRTRFGGSYLGFLVVVAWPLSHMGILIVVHLAISHYIALGTDPATFYATGILPYILCIYPGRFIATALIMNRNLLSLPPVSPLQIIFARGASEFLNAFVVAAIFISILFLSGVDFVPHDIYSAFGAVCATIYLGFGFGVLNVALSVVLGRFYIIFFVLIIVGMYVTSGVYFDINLPSGALHDALTYNPLYNLVGWLRAAYYLDLPRVEYSKLYIIQVATVSLALGLASERFLRGRFLRG